MAWQEDARDFAASLASLTAATVTETALTDRLIEFRFDPRNDDAAPISLIVAESEVTFGAGRGTRVETVSLSQSAEEVQRLVQGVFAGGLRETVKRRSVRFSLRLGDGSEVTGSSYGLPLLSEPYGDLDYGPYQ